MSDQLPTVVFVHGAFAESASWNGVIERLRLASRVQPVPSHECVQFELRAQRLAFGS